MKGKERVCHVTEADMPGPAGSPFGEAKLRLLGGASGACAEHIREKCLHVRSPRPAQPSCAESWDRSKLGFAPVRGGFYGIPRRNAVPPQGDAGDQALDKGIWWMPWH